MPQDAQGLEVTAASDAAAALLDATVAAYCGLRRDAGDSLKAMLACDNELAMGHIVRGCFMMLFATRGAVARAGIAAKVAASSIAARGATAREASHLAALEMWAQGGLAAAAAQWDAILAEHPRDLLAVKLAQYAHFYLGDAAAMRASTLRALGALDETVPGYGYVLGCHAFSLEECGDYAAAETSGRRAVMLDPGDIWAAHAVAHVFEMEDRPEDGAAWVASQQQHWGETNNFAFHAFWHRCLFLLALRRTDEVLALYDREVRAELTDEYLDISNAVSLLWRLEQEGVAIGARWDELAARARPHIDDHVLVFADLHYLMALVAAGDEEGVENWRAASRAYAEAGNDDAAHILAGSGIVLGEAALAHRRGDFARVVELLDPLGQSVRRIGGSHAQRDLFALMRIDAALKAAPAHARVLLAARLAARPRNAWGLRYAAFAARL